MTTKNTSMSFLYPGRGKQHGATLITALIMLVVLTLLAVSGIRASSTNLRIAGNTQVQTEARAAVQQAIEEVISNTDFTLATPAAKNVKGYIVTFDKPVCLSSSPTVKTDILPADCGGSVGATYCYWTTWNIAASAVDANTGATAELHQGVSVLAGSNAVLKYCGT